MDLFREDGCLTDEGLLAVTKGGLDELGRLETAEHLSYCDRCMDRYTALLTADALETPPKPLRGAVMSNIWVRLMQNTYGRVEALAIGLVAGDVLFGHAVGAHHAPLVVVAEVAAVRVAAAQPDLSNVLKAAVLVDLAGRNVAVIVADGHILCIIVIQMLSRSRLEHEFLIHKCFHGSNSFSDSFIEW